MWEISDMWRILHFLLYIKMKMVKITVEGKEIEEYPCEVNFMTSFSVAKWVLVIEWWFNTVNTKMFTLSALLKFWGCIPQQLFLT